MNLLLYLRDKELTKGSFLNESNGDRKGLPNQGNPALPVRKSRKVKINDI